MERKIDKIRSEIDGLSEACYEAVGCEGWSDNPTVEQRKQERLGILLLKLEDGDLKSRYIRRMEKWLLADPEALCYYIDFMSLTAMLNEYYHPEKAEKLLSFCLQQV